LPLLLSAGVTAEVFGLWFLAEILYFLPQLKKCRTAAKLILQINHCSTIKQEKKG
jgi:hypothetical protein